jgi:transcriptional regulator with XRE-family HTH domain
VPTKVTLSGADPRKLLGNAVKKRRLHLGLTQEQLAEAADLHWTYISGIERGIRNVTIVNLVHIATALNVRVRELVKSL